MHGILAHTGALLPASVNLHGKDAIWAAIARRIAADDAASGILSTHIVFKHHGGPVFYEATSGKIFKILKFS